MNPDLLVAAGLLFTKSTKWLEILGEHSFLHYSQVLFATFPKTALEKKKKNKETELLIKYTKKWDFYEK